MAHPSMEGKNVWDTQTKDGVYSTREIVSAALNGGGFTYYDWPLPGNEKQIEPKITYSEKDPNWNWIVCAGSYLSDYNAGANHILYIFLITLGLSLIVGMLSILWFSRRFTTPVIQVAEQVKLMSEGDLTSKPIEIHRNDELGELVNSFNQMKVNMVVLISRVHENAEQVAASSVELFASVEEVTHATSEVARRIQEMNQGALLTAQATEESSTAMNELATGTARIAQAVLNVAEGSLQASKEAEEGNHAIQEAVQQMDEIRESVNHSVDLVKKLGERSQEIGKIIEVITSITDQTNLLALNAAIEAARAGEHGRGGHRYEALGL